MYGERYIEKLLFFENVQTCQSQFFPFQIPITHLLVDLSPVIQCLFKCSNENHFAIYLPEPGLYCPLSRLTIRPFVIPSTYLELNIIMLKFAEDYTMLEKIQNVDLRVKMDEPKKMPNIPEDFRQGERKQRSKQRSIIEAIELVGEWRILQTKLIDGKRLSLKETADQIGVSKKSLDDYFYQLRVGECYGFDFQSHYEDKIGILRAFVKAKERENKQFNIKMKLPKKLLIIEAAKNRKNQTDKTRHISSVWMEKPKVVESIIVVSHNRQKESKKKQKQGFFWGDPFDSMNPQFLVDCQKNFFNDFREDIPEDDPFIYGSFQKNQNYSQNSLDLF